MYLANRTLSLSGLFDMCLMGLVRSVIFFTSLSSTLIKLDSYPPDSILDVFLKKAYHATSESPCGLQIRTVSPDNSLCKKNYSAGSNQNRNLSVLDG